MHRLFFAALSLAAAFLLTSVSAEEGRWQLRLSLPSGQINDAVFATPDSVWAVGPGGVFLSGDSGRSWQHVSTGQGLAAVDAAPDGLHGWAVAGEGTIMATTDGGQTWTRQQSGTDIHLVDVAAVNGKVAFALGRGRGYSDIVDPDPPRILLKTANGGQTWAEVKLNPSYKLEAMYFLDDGLHGWLSIGWPSGTGRALLKTEDGGASWTMIDKEGQHFIVKMQFLTPEVGWAQAIDCPSPTGRCLSVLLRSIDGGLTWQQVGPPDSSTEVRTFLALSDRTALLSTYRGYSENQLLRTDDAGATWQSLGGSDAQPTKLFTSWDETNGVRVNDLNEVTWTTDSRSWQPSSMPVTSGSGAIEFLDSLTGWVAGSELLHTRDGGLTWETAGDVGLVSLDFVSNTEGWGVQRTCDSGQGCWVAIIHTMDGGRTWENQTNHAAYWPSSIVFPDRLNGWLDLDQNGLLHTTDGGRSWQELRPPGRIFAFVDANVVWTTLPWSGSEMPVWLSLDGGVTWREAGRVESADLCGTPILAAIDAQHAWILWRRCGGQPREELDRTADGGLTWQRSSLPNVVEIQAVKFFDAAQGIAAGPQCDVQRCWDVLLRTSDGGATWSVESPDLQRASSVSMAPPVPQRHQYKFIDPQHAWRLAAARGPVSLQNVHSYSGPAPETPISMPPSGSGAGAARPELVIASALAVLGLGALTLLKRRVS